jgi:hypothetical protein
VEDDELLRGRGRFGDDVRPERAAAAVFVRSVCSSLSGSNCRFVAPARINCCSRTATEAWHLQTAWRCARHVGGLSIF